MNYAIYGTSYKPEVWLLLRQREGMWELVCQCATVELAEDVSAALQESEQALEKRRLAAAK